MPVPPRTAGVAGLLECLWLKDKFLEGWGGGRGEKEKKKKVFQGLRSGTR